MSIRRRAISERVERERRLKLQGAEMDRSLAAMQRVLDDLKAEGNLQFDQAEFWRRYHARMAA
jgi:hypothetical protein